MHRSNCELDSRTYSYISLARCLELIALSSDLDHLFTTTLLQFSHLKPNLQIGSTKSDAERIKRMADLTDCLRVYDMLNTWRDAEEVVRKEIVRAFIKKVRILLDILPNIVS